MVFYFFFSSIYTLKKKKFRLKKESFIFMNLIAWLYIYSMYIYAVNNLYPNPSTTAQIHINCYVFVRRSHMAHTEKSRENIYRVYLAALNYITSFFFENAPKFGNILLFVFLVIFFLFFWWRIQKRLNFIWNENKVLSMGKSKRNSLENTESKNHQKFNLKINNSLAIEKYWCFPPNLNWSKVESIKS